MDAASPRSPFDAAADDDTADDDVDDKQQHGGWNDDDVDEFREEVATPLIPAVPRRFEGAVKGQQQICVALRHLVNCRQLLQLYTAGSWVTSAVSPFRHGSGGEKEKKK